MKRWIKNKEGQHEAPKIDAFIADILRVCKSHGLSISHEDEHGAFVIEKFERSLAGWLEKAAVGTTLYLDDDESPDKRIYDISLADLAEIREYLNQDHDDHAVASWARAVVPKLLVAIDRLVEDSGLLLPTIQ